MKRFHSIASQAGFLFGALYLVFRPAGPEASIWPAVRRAPCAIWSTCKDHDSAAIPQA